MAEHFEPASPSFRRFVARILNVPKAEVDQLRAKELARTRRQRGKKKAG